jgi:prefoldin subunit 5
MAYKIKTLKAELNELLKAEEELRRTEETLREMMRHKEAELKRLLLQKQLSSFKFS